MRRITILIPTRNRAAKLETTLKSLERKGSFFDVAVVIDAGELDGYKALADLGKFRFHVDWLYTKEQLGSCGARNNFLRKFNVTDGLLYATDDVIFQDGFGSLLEDFNSHFPCNYGVLGCQQAEPHHPTGVALLGREFLDSYPYHVVFNPVYWHFAAQEVHWNAQKRGVFALSREVIVSHTHPDRDKRQMDATHIDARLHRSRDLNLKDHRLAEGRAWGSPESREEDCRIAENAKVARLYEL